MCSCSGCRSSSHSPAPVRGMAVATWPPTGSWFRPRLIAGAAESYFSRQPVASSVNWFAKLLEAACPVRQRWRQRGLPQPEIVFLPVATIVYSPPPVANWRPTKTPSPVPSASSRNSRRYLPNHFLHSTPFGTAPWAAVD